MLEKHVDPQQEREFSPTPTPPAGLLAGQSRSFALDRVSPGPQRYRASSGGCFPLSY